MKIWLTGAQGMVGKNILEHKQAVNYQFLTPSSKELNLLNLDDVRNFLKIHKPDLIIHGAGVVGGIQANMNNPVKFLYDNMIMGMNVIHSAAEAEIKNLLNLASSCMYPKSAPNPLQENLILTGALEPTNEGYALAKVSAMKLCEYISREKSDYFYRTLIPCNLYGKHDKFDPKHSHMIPAVIKKIHEAKVNDVSAVDIWGDGTARREFMYVADLADFIFHAIPRIGDMPQTINVGLGVDYSINEYYKIVAEVVNYQGTFSHDLSKPIGMHQKLIDTKKAASFGWQNKTTLRDGIEKTYQFYLESISHD